MLTFTTCDVQRSISQYRRCSILILGFPHHCRNSSQEVFRRNRSRSSDVPCDVRGLKFRLLFRNIFMVLSRIIIFQLLVLMGECKHSRAERNAINSDILSSHHLFADKKSSKKEKEKKVFNSDPRESRVLTLVSLEVDIFL